MALVIQERSKMQRLLILKKHNDRLRKSDLALREMERSGLDFVAVYNNSWWFQSTFMEKYGKLKLPALVIYPSKYEKGRTIAGVKGIINYIGNMTHDRRRSKRICLSKSL